jgi:hypothetical protein
MFESDLELAHGEFMNKAERVEMLRRSAGRKSLTKPYLPRGASCANTGAAPQKLWKPYLTSIARPAKLDSNPFGPQVFWSSAPWIERPDKKPKRTLKTKPRRVEHALLVIAAKAPKKLVRTYRTAEGLLDARARR